MKDLKLSCASTVEKITPRSLTPSERDESFRNWTMIALTISFVLLYGTTLSEWLTSDQKTAVRLEPFIFAIIGFHLSRLTSLQNHRELKEEILNQTRRADALQAIKEQALQSQAALEEKITNVSVLLGDENALGTKRVVRIEGWQRVFPKSRGGYKL